MEPRRHGDVVEDLAADLVVDAEALQEIFVAHAQVERAEAPTIVAVASAAIRCRRPRPPRSTARGSGCRPTIRAGRTGRSRRRRRRARTDARCSRAPTCRCRWSGPTGRGGGRRRPCAGRRRCPSAARRCRRGRRRSARPAGATSVWVTVHSVANVVPCGSNGFSPAVSDVPKTENEPGDPFVGLRTRCPPPSVTLGTVASSTSE